jgi:N-methylhydantoinase B/oxoprolinase/acetone carboxylase alpha subunit
LKKRTDSGGQGDQKGGDGILKSYQLMEAATLRWFSGYPVKNETNPNSGLGMAPEIVVKIGEEETTHTNLRGELSLPKGAIVTALSRGGHAFSKD